MPTQIAPRPAVEYFLSHQRYDDRALKTVSLEDLPCGSGSFLEKQPEVFKEGDFLCTAGFFPAPSGTALLSGGSLVAKSRLGWNPDPVTSELRVHGRPLGFPF